VQEKQPPSPVYPSSCCPTHGTGGTTHPLGNWSARREEAPLTPPRCRRGRAAGASVTAPDRPRSAASPFTPATPEPGPAWILRLVLIVPTRPRQSAHHGTRVVANSAPVQRQDASNSYIVSRPARARQPATCKLHEVIMALRRSGPWAPVEADHPFYGVFA
jgi:hypothetical protein